MVNPHKNRVICWLDSSISSSVNSRNGRFLKRVNSQRGSTKRATRLSSQPLVYTSSMISMATSRQNLNHFLLLKYPKTDRTLRFFHNIFEIIGIAQKNDRKAVYDDSFKPMTVSRLLCSCRVRLRSRDKTTVGGGAPAAQPLPIHEQHVEEEDENEETDGK